jgi:plastocyanin
VKPPSLPPRPAVLNDAAMVFLRLSGMTGVLAVLYAVFGRERAGLVLLGSLSIASLAAGITVALDRRPEVAILEPVPEGPPALHRVRRLYALPGPSATPIAGAAAVTLLAAATLWGPAVAIFGAIIGLGTAFSASAVVSGEQRGRTVEVLPVAIPVMVLFAIGSFMFLMSRILLAVPAHASTVVALVFAVLILGGAFFVANRPAVPSRVLLRALAVVGVLFLGGGLAAAAVGQRPEERKAGPPPVKLAAHNIKFDKSVLKLAADSPAVIDFKNEDTVPHNVDVTSDQAGTQSIFRQDPLPGPTTVQYKFTAPAAGHYFFHCDVHPNMTGAIDVAPTAGGAAEKQTATTAPATTKPAPAKSPPPSAKAAPPPPAGAGPTSGSVTAQGIAFVQKQLKLAANSPVVVHFDNADAGIPHNIDFTKDDAGNDVIFKGDITTGPTKTDYKFTTPGPGNYFFHCDVHPNMQGKLTIS